MDGWTISLAATNPGCEQFPLLAPPKRSHCDDVRDFLNIKRPWIEKYLKLEWPLFTMLTYGEIFSATRWNQRSLYLGLAQDSVISGFELMKSRWSFFTKLCHFKEDGVRRRSTRIIPSVKECGSQ